MPSATGASPGDYVREMWLMLQLEVPEDYVVATGVAHGVKHLLELAFAHVGLNYRDHVEVAQYLLRPADVHVFHRIHVFIRH